MVQFSMQLHDCAEEELPEGSFRGVPEGCYMVHFGELQSTEKCYIFILNFMRNRSTHKEGNMPSFTTII